MKIESFSRNALGEEQSKSEEQYTKNLQKLTDLSQAEYDLTTMSQAEIDKLKETTRGIEQIFVKMLTDQMRKSIQRPQSDSASLGQSKDLFEEMLYDEYGKKLTEQHSFGIADTLFRQLTTPVVRPQDLERLYQNQINTQAKPNPE
ncbi:rod-binding protein [Entomospira culicis]|uniref:Flagellar protein FlgJ N-terminal domain-containing protein n=1 Tax=Entomospira culicis TaxID=2719989 RepID=A0A968GHG5_9SPIO|nr:rod-binding protein [Entomospira culicis]NIZ18499.1 hypothetical protein [Entomospira culicis]NIZ68715.1 hypothetical protein [Entomospira culicis]WDI37313.1 rod-binding protein [Entomospira culicis]WDI38942.1 rod-binding protein [Entomospira culicis]